MMGSYSRQYWVACLLLACILLIACGTPDARPVRRQLGVCPQPLHLWITYWSGDLEPDRNNMISRRTRKEARGAPDTTDGTASRG
ncbi:hypothetical protein BD779DRAFT_1519322 [Infundibulicybe gibba]|nr:hypothetical protein BD779DRAFT_1519322 [Infundibulicybe gibba]